MVVVVMVHRTDGIAGVHHHVEAADAGAGIVRCSLFRISDVLKKLIRFS